MLEAASIIYDENLKADFPLNRTEKQKQRYKRHSTFDDEDEEFEGFNRARNNAMDGSRVEEQNGWIRHLPKPGLRSYLLLQVIRPGFCLRLKQNGKHGRNGIYFVK